MTVHAVRVRSEKPSQYSMDQIRQAVQGWVDRYSEAITTQRVDVRLVDPGENVPTPRHVYGV